MRLKFIKADEIDRNVKATVHSTGKTGFSAEAIKKLHLKDRKGACIAIDEDDNERKALYVSLHQDYQPGDFKVVKAGEYFYINTSKEFFDSCGIDYRTGKIIFDIVEFEHEGQKMFKFLKREIRKKKK